MKRLREAGERRKLSFTPLVSGKNVGDRAPRPPNLRGIKAEDVTFISALAGKAFNQYGPYEECIRQWIDTDAVLGYLAFSAKKPAGFVMISSVHFLTNVMFELMAIAVSPDQRHKGIAGLLLQKAEERATKEGGLYMLLHTATSNTAARTFFESHGYKAAGEKPRYYPAGQDAVRMIKALKKKRK